MADDNYTMLQRDLKESQRRDNYRRAEAFLIWKLGTHGHEEINRQLRLNRANNLEALLVEFCEKVEEDLLARMEYIEKLYRNTVELKAVSVFAKLNEKDSFLQRSTDVSVL